MRDPAQLVERNRFSGVVKSWTREQLVHEIVVLRELARGAVKGGLRYQGISPKWVTPPKSFRRDPHVGYVGERAKANEQPMVVGLGGLSHLP